MRQVGYMAAAANYALDNNLNDLANDHKKAIELGNILTNLPYVKLVQPIDTNIVIFSLHPQFNEDLFIENLLNKNIRLIQLGKGKIRIVTHRDYTDNHHEYTIKTLTNFKF